MHLTLYAGSSLRVLGEISGAKHSPAPPVHVCTEFLRTWLTGRLAPQNLGSRESPLFFRIGAPGPIQLQVSPSQVYPRTVACTKQAMASGCTHSPTLAAWAFVCGH